MNRRRLCALIVSFMAAGNGHAQTEGDLAKQLANPLASLISVPFQSNFDFDVGSDDGFRYTLNVQPVVPVGLSERWNLISRTIVPVVYQAGVLPGMGDQFGLGDTVQSIFFSRGNHRTAGGLIWGVGPVLLLPTATDDPLGADQWGAGPTGVIVKQQGPWTYGLLANHIVSVTGDDDRPDVESTFFQPFLSRTNGSVTYTVNFEGTFDHEADEWTLPLQSVRQQGYESRHPAPELRRGREVLHGRAGQRPALGYRANVTLLYPR